MIEASQQPPQPRNPQTLIEGQGISLRFGQELLLDRVDFQIFQGESLVLIGPSGHGKSSLLKILAGLIEPTEGRLEVEGEEWRNLTITRRNLHFRKRGMLFQKNALFDSMTAFENVCFPLRETTSFNEAEIQQKAQAALEAVGLEKALDLFPDEMSGGMQKRLGLARALVLEPPLLFNDDPVAGLDPIASRKIIQLILEMKKTKGITVVSVLNDINRAFEAATRLMMVMDKQVFDLGTPDQARHHGNEKIQRFLQGEPA